MRVKSIFILLYGVFFGSIVNAQIEFEKGYYIDNTGLRIEGFIKNIEWLRNPNEFEFKPTKDASSKRIDLHLAKEFGIGSTSKYVLYEGDIDRSPEEISELDSKRNPQWSTEQLFIKTLIEGEASLYYYEDTDIRRYFYNVGSNTIQQLVYKQFRNGGLIGTNERFRQQLLIELNCENHSEKFVRSVSYNRSDLLRYFKSYNECIGAPYLDFRVANKQYRNAFGLKITPGVNYSSLSTNNIQGNSQDTNFGSKANFRVGLEAEFILPFNRNKWSLVVEPTWHSFSAIQDLALYNRSVKVDYRSLEIPLGLRHYFFLSDKAKVHLNGLWVLDFDFNSIFDYSDVSDLEISSIPYFAGGIGFTYNKL